MAKKCIKGNAYDPAIYRDDAYTWQEGEYTVFRTTAYTAPGCHDGCGVLYYMKDGRIEKVEGDPRNGYSQGTLCPRCLMMTEALYDKNRLKYPIKRDRAQRGKDTWERISWDEAYGMIVEKARAYSAEYTSACIVVHQGTGRNVTWQTPWLAYAGFQTPNYGSGFLSGDSCYTPRASIMAFAAGDFMIADMSQTHPERYDAKDWSLPGCTLIWGCDPVVSNADGFLGHWIVEAMKRGSKVVVVDPRCTWIASKAEYWLQLRPGTDAALAMAIINVIIEEDLWDHDFVNNWCDGFDDLAKAVKEWTCERAAEVCWADADKIRAAARFIASCGPVALQWGVATDMQASATPLCHAILAIIGLTGSVDVPGGSIVIPGHAFNTGLEPWLYPEVFQGLAERFGGEEEMSKRRIGRTYPFKSGGYLSNTSPDKILEVIESHGELSDTDPKFPVKMGFYVGTDPVANMGAEAPRIYEAMQNVEFNVFINYAMTPSIMAGADLVLPCAMTPERDSVRAWWTPLRSIIKVTEYYEARSDEQIIFDLIRRLNPDLYIGDTVEEWLSRAVNYGSLEYGFQGLKERVIDWPEWDYRKYEKGLLREDKSPGFRTLSGRYQLTVPMLEMIGLSPVPFYEEPHESPYSTPELAEKYPYVLTSGRRIYEFFHSEHRNMPTLRASHPDPLVEMNSETAKSISVGEGEWVWIENHRGRCRQKVTFNDSLDPRVIMAEHGWWFPEAEPERLFNTFDSNINNLTSQCDVGKSGIGCAYKSVLCNVYPCTEENSRITPTEQVIEKGGWNYERKQLA